MRAAAIVLAGGASRRFGADKLAAEIDGRPVLAHAIGAVGRVAGPVIVVLAQGAPAPAAADGCIVARDLEAFGGPLAGLAAGLAALPEPAPDLAIVVGGDMPMLVPVVLELLVAKLEGDRELAVALLEADPVATLPVAIRVALVAPVASALLAEERRSLRALVDALPSAVVPGAAWRPLDPGASTLRDVDVPADLG